MPPFFTKPLPASNCGLIKAITSPLSFNNPFNTGKTFSKEIKETSMVAKSNKKSNLSLSRYLILVLSIHTTLSSLRKVQSSCPYPTSTQYTFLAPYLRRQSVNPPVEAPTSIIVFPLTSIPNSVKAFSSLSPPLLTKREASFFIYN